MCGSLPFPSHIIKVCLDAGLYGIIRGNKNIAITYFSHQISVLLFYRLVNIDKGKGFCRL